jgi:hypothetical protein
MPWALRSVMPRLAAMSRSRAPGSCPIHISTRAWLVRKLQFAMTKQFTIYSSNTLLVYNCGYKLRATQGTGRRSCRPERAMFIAWAAGLPLRGMSSLGQTMARHLLT